MEEKNELQHDLRSENYTYEIPIERWFQASTRLEQFIFSFFLVNWQSQQLISHISVYPHLLFAEFTLNIFLLLLREWLHGIFNYT